VPKFDFSSTKKSANSSGSWETAHNAVVLADHPTLSIANQESLSSPFADNYKKAVDGTGIAPVGFWVINQNRHYTPPTANSLYQNEGQSQSDIFWDKIISIECVGYEQVYDIEVEGTHNFIGNSIFAHNTYISATTSIMGNVGIGTTTPGYTLTVAGQCVTGDTRLRRRRRNSKSKTLNSKFKIQNEEGDYIYDEVMIKDIKPGD